MFAAHHHLSNLIVLIDYNHIQIEGNVDDVMSIDPLRAKLKAFNWNVREVDGHSFAELITVGQQAKTATDRPTAIICHTTPGKGVSFMENNYQWHGKPPNAQQTKQALLELNRA
ncbi:MAG: transketolase, partial [bacterium]|nr:transketolase [bacterium]